jgi:hypothetical protein
MMECKRDKNRAEPQCYEGLDQTGASFAFCFLCTHQQQVTESDPEVECRNRTDYAADGPDSPEFSR